MVYENFAFIPNWLVYDMKGERIPMVKTENIGHELTASAIWLLCHQNFSRVDFTIRFIMDDLGIDTKRKPNKIKWVNIVTTLLKNGFMAQREEVGDITIDTRLKCLINKSIFDYDEEGNRINYAVVSIDKIEQILSLDVDRPKMVCVYGYGEVRCYRNQSGVYQYTKDHKAETFWGNAENLAKDICLSVNTWEKYTDVLNDLGIMLNRSYYKGTTRHTTYAFDLENLEQGVSYYSGKVYKEEPTEDEIGEEQTRNIAIGFNLENRPKRSIRGVF